MYLCFHQDKGTYFADIDKPVEDLIACKPAFFCEPDFISRLQIRTFYVLEQPLAQAAGRLSRKLLSGLLDLLIIAIRIVIFLLRALLCASFNSPNISGFLHLGLFSCSTFEVTWWILRRAFSFGWLRWLQGEHRPCHSTTGNDLFVSLTHLIVVDFPYVILNKVVKLGERVTGSIELY